MNLDAVIFLTSAMIAVFGATMMVFQRNPVVSVLYFIVSLLAQAVLYMQLGGLFMGAVLIIVYAGAIMVLFLFVIMLLNLRGGEDLGRPSPPISRVTKYTLSLLVVAELVMIIRSSFAASQFLTVRTSGLMTLDPGGFGSVEDVAGVLFQKYLYPFELVSILLLSAVVGAVLMARREQPGDYDSGDRAPEDVVNPVDESVK
jgi:NADH-quinone oxidoreductase subunit J